jgi:hypothetical protein
VRRNGRNRGLARQNSFFADSEPMKPISSEIKSWKHRLQSRARWHCFLGCVAALVVATGVGLIRTHAQESFPLPAINPPGAKASPPAAPAAPTQSARQPAQPQAGAGGASTAEVAKQCSDLLKMATDLKIEVDKTTKDTLSVAAMRKAGQIEQFARKARTGGTEKK